MDSTDIENISFIKLSKHREKVFLNIGTKLKMPSEIAKSTNLVLSDVSRALRGLKDKKLVECLNEDVNQGRLYKLTEKGIDVYDIVNQD
ncbi:MAG: MarR family transcriptional regulator [Methanobacteriaceae archaeon]